MTHSVCPLAKAAAPPPLTPSRCAQIIASGEVRIPAGENSGTLTATLQPVEGNSHRKHGEDVPVCEITFTYSYGPH